MLECPEMGGDTVFCDTNMAYDKLSVPFRERLHGLRGEHGDVGLVEETRKRGKVDDLTVLLNSSGLGPDFALPGKLTTPQVA